MTPLGAVTCRWHRTESHTLNLHSIWHLHPKLFGLILLGEFLFTLPIDSPFAVVFCSNACSSPPLPPNGRHLHRSHCLDVCLWSGSFALYIHLICLPVHQMLGHSAPLPSRIDFTNRRESNWSAPIWCCTALSIAFPAPLGNHSFGPNVWHSNLHLVDWLALQ